MKASVNQHLEELFAAPISTLTVSHDPLNGGQFESETNTLIVSNPNLQPEDSRSFSGGLVYTPKYVPGLTLTVDLWDIERTGVVAAPTTDQVLAREATGTLLPGEVVERDAGGFIRALSFLTRIWEHKPHAEWTSVFNIFGKQSGEPSPG